jgi:hypothetical protein
MKEEYRNGKSSQESIRVGFSRAWSAIRDGNVTALLSAVILFWFGTPLIKGFALVLGIGTIISMLSYQAFTDMKGELLGDLGSNESIKVVNDIDTRYPDVFSGFVVLVLIGFWAFAMVSAYISNDHPILFIFMMILMVFVLISSMMLGNFYEEFFDDAEYSGLTASFAIPDFIMTHIMEISIGVLISSLLVAYAKNRYD